MKLLNQKWQSALLNSLFSNSSFIRSAFPPYASSSIGRAAVSKAAG